MRLPESDPGSQHEHCLHFGFGYLWSAPGLPLPFGTAALLRFDECFFGEAGAECFFGEVGAGSASSLSFPLPFPPPASSSFTGTARAFSLRASAAAPVVDA